MGLYRSLYLWSRMVILCLSFCTCALPGDLIRLGLLWFKVMLLRLMFLGNKEADAVADLGRLHQDAGGCSPYSS